MKKTANLLYPTKLSSVTSLRRKLRFRIIETQKGVLLVPLTGEAVNDELKAQLGEWQTLGAEGWETFDFEENAS